MSFHVGQKIVCVDASKRPYNEMVPALVKGRIYTVDGFDFAECVVLAEQPGQLSNGEFVKEFGFKADRFRPLIERKASTETGISILRKVADDASNRRNLVVTR